MIFVGRCGFVWKCRVPLHPMVCLIIIPTSNGYFIGGIPHFQTYPYSCNIVTKTVLMAIEIVIFPIKNGDFPIKNGDFPMKNGDFPMKNGDFPIKNGDFCWRMSFTQLLREFSSTQLLPFASRALQPFAARCRPVRKSLAVVERSKVNKTVLILVQLYNMYIIMYVCNVM